MFMGALFLTIVFSEMIIIICRVNDVHVKYSETSFSAEKNFLGCARFGLICAIHARLLILLQWKC